MTWVEIYHALNKIECLISSGTRQNANHRKSSSETDVYSSRAYVIARGIHVCCMRHSDCAQCRTGKSQCSTERTVKRQTVWARAVPTQLR